MSYVLMIKMIISGVLGKLSKSLEVFDNFLDSKKSGNALNNLHSNALIMLLI